MEKNKSSLTISQALKLYNGSSGLIKLPLQWTGLIVTLYLSTIIFFTLLIGFENGFAAAWEEVSEELMSNMFFAIQGSIATALLSGFTYEKNIPGGKFFRTVKGGFDTYKKMRTAFTLSTVIMICLFTGIICAINAVIPIMLHGTVTCISVAVFLLLGTGITNLINLLENALARSVLNIVILFALGLVGVFTVYISNGKLGMIHMTAVILAIMLIPISHRLMLTSYKKHRWDH